MHALLCMNQVDSFPRATTMGVFPSIRTYGQFDASAVAPRWLAGWLEGQVSLDLSAHSVISTIYFSGDLGTSLNACYTLLTWCEMDGAKRLSLVRNVGGDCCSRRRSQMVPLLSQSLLLLIREDIKGHRCLSPCEFDHEGELSVF